MLAAMKNGKHTATEVPAAMTVDDCWAIVEAAEKLQKHCVMMENCNYDRMEMMVFNMVRQGLFGEILHAEGGYLHDLRSIKFENTDEGLWRRAWATKLNGNLYPTHGLGPIANCLDINRGDRFDYLVSMSGPSRGLQAWAAEHVPADSPKRARAVRPGRRQRQPDQDGAWPHHRRRARHQPAASVQPHSHGAGHQGAVPGLSGPRLHRRPRQGGSVAAGRRRRRRRSSIRSGRRSPSARRAPATAAWTSSRTTA